MRKQLAGKNAQKTTKIIATFDGITPKTANIDLLSVFACYSPKVFALMCFCSSQSRQLNVECLLFSKVLVIHFDHEVYSWFWVSDRIQYSKEAQSARKKENNYLQVQ